MAMASIQYLGHSAFLIEMAGRTILTDPWLNPNPKEVKRLLAPAITADKIRKCDMILISHEHFDHCDPYDASSIAERTFAYVVAPEDAMAKLTVPSRTKTTVVEGDKFSLIGLDIEVVTAKHSAEKGVGYVIGGEGKRIYFAGDTYEFSGMSSIRCDVAMLPIGGTFTMDLLSAVTAAKQIRPRYVVPMHYNTFQQIKADPMDFARRLKGSKVEPIVLGVGESFSF